MVSAVVGKHMRPLACTTRPTGYNPQRQVFTAENAESAEMTERENPTRITESIIAAAAVNRYPQRNHELRSLGI